MKTYFKFFVFLFAAAFVFSGAAAQAASVVFAHQVPTDNSGKTSPYGVDASNTPLPGYYIETFDGSTVPGVYPLPNGGTVNSESGGWFMSVSPNDIYVTPNTTGTMGIRIGSTSYAATPANDTTNFAYAPGQGGGLPVAVEVDYTSFLTATDQWISYLGIYYGSIDNYNEVYFYSGGNPVSGSGVLSDGKITGAEILAAQGGTSGDRFGVGSNVYVNLFFNYAEKFTSFEFQTSGVAFEIDNVVTGFTPVPVPAAVWLFGTGFLGLVGVRRNYKKRLVA